MQHMHRASSAHTNQYMHRTASPRTYGKPDFREGSILEEKDKAGRVLHKHKVGRLLGRGGFAKCYSFTDLDTGKTFACKVIDRQSLQKSKTFQKLQSEIAIHKRMKHHNIVNFLRHFQDEWFVYLILEKCSNQTLMEVSKARRRFTVAETQFIMIQSLSAMQYMHENNVIHRDLKLGNMMLDEDMNVKIGDFGLAAELSYDGERKRTICGTPNYIAPEILEGHRNGHSFEADVWSLGVILYTLLVGEPPFQTTDVKSTYDRIKRCRYNFPPGLDLPESAKNLIHRILQSKPESRPTLMDMRSDPFFRYPSPPTSAPLSLFPEHVRRQRERDAAVLEQIVPNVAQAVGGKGLGALGENDIRVAKKDAGKDDGARRPSPRLFSARSSNAMAPSAGSAPSSARASSGSTAQPLTRRSSAAPASFVPSAPRASQPQVGGWMAPPEKKEEEPARFSSRPSSAAAPSVPSTKVEDEEERNQLAQMHDQLHQTLIADAPAQQEEPASLPGPTAWVSDYADFSNKYGLAYKMNTGHTGVHYNDSTKMVWEPVTNRVEYYDRLKERINGVTHAQDRGSTFHMDSHPDNLNKKVTLIKYFKSYLARSRGGSVQVVSCSPFTDNQSYALTEPHMVSDMVYVKRWLITQQAMIFRLSNRTIQVCFQDNRSDLPAEVILSSESRVVSFTDASGRRKTIPLSAVTSQPQGIADRLRYTKDILHRLINNREL